MTLFLISPATQALYQIPYTAMQYKKTASLIQRLG